MHFLLKSPIGNDFKSPDFPAFFLRNLKKNALLIVMILSLSRSGIQSADKIS